MIHESGCWSEVHRKWFFLPRRCSKEQYNDSLDERRGCNVLLSADSNMYDVSVVEVIGFLKSTSLIYNPIYFVLVKKSYKH